MDILDVRPAGGNDAARKVAITFEHGGDRLIGLGATNGFLKLVSLGLYTFWAKTEVRRRLWSFTRINGEPLEYTGTGRELFLGFLTVFAVIIVPVLIGGVAVAFLFPGNPRALTLFQLVVYLFFFLLVGNAIYRAQRYRLSRTRWRGIRGALTGSPGSYGWTYFWTIALPFVGIALAALLFSWASGPQVGGLIMTVGLIAGLWVLPWRANKLQGMMTRAMYFGDRQLSYSGRSGPLYKRYLYVWAASALVLLAALWATASYVFRSGMIEQWQALRVPPSVPQILSIIGIWALAALAAALITAWYRAEQYRHFAAHTHFEGATFRSEVTGKGLAWLVLTNWLLSMLGIISGFALGAFLIYWSGLGPAQPLSPDAPRELPLLPILIVVAPVVVMSTLTSTFAQFRSARYFLSRIDLDGPVDLDSVLQSGAATPKRGEGLAQVFDIDAF